MGRPPRMSRKGVKWTRGPWRQYGRAEPGDLVSGVGDAPLCLDPRDQWHSSNLPVRVFQIVSPAGKAGEKFGGPGGWDRWGTRLPPCTGFCQKDHIVRGGGGLTHG